MTETNEVSSPVTGRFTRPLRRLAAFGLDFLIITGYIVLLGTVGLVIYQASGDSPAAGSPVITDLIAFFSLVLPVILYFAISESSPRQASWGKHRLGLIVVDRSGERVNFSRALVRSGFKFLPWQLAHTSVIQLWFGSESPVVFAGAILAQLLVLGYVLFLFFHRCRQTPYDWIAGTFVMDR